MSEEKVEKTWEDHKQEIEQEVEENGGMDEVNNYMTNKEHIEELERLSKQTPEEVAEEHEKMRQELERKSVELFEKEIAMTLTQHNLQAFKDVINVNTSQELQDAIQKLTGIVNDIKIQSGYVPKDNLKQAEYETAKEKGDTKSMIKTLFGFGK